ncbi:hypothetical protein KAU30_04160 [Candidatus Bathyarchaeota archaeon]|nr:hypothetical protein [Candidatus Bathyarchaeota archaeon]
MVEIKAVLFDLHGTLAYVENPISGEEISNYLFSRGYEVSPQQLKAAWAFVAFIDCPKHGYKSWRSYFSRIFWRVKIRVDKETLVNGDVSRKTPFFLFSECSFLILHDFC